MKKSFLESEIISKSCSITSQIYGTERTYTYLSCYQSRRLFPVFMDNHRSRAINAPQALGLDHHSGISCYRTLPAELYLFPSQGETFRWQRSMSWLMRCWWSLIQNAFHVYSWISAWIHPLNRKRTSTTSIFLTSDRHSQHFVALHHHGLINQ